jgi:L-rhamnose isomerase
VSKSRTFINLDLIFAFWYILQVAIGGQEALRCLRGGVQETSNYGGKAQPPESKTLLDDLIRIMILIGGLEMGSPWIVWCPARIAVSTSESRKCGLT